MSTTTVPETRTSPAEPAELSAETVAARALALAEALDEAGDAVDPAAAARARADLASVAARLRVGAGRTVVALVGGTGSGKSSLFNAISGLRFADVGALRPTTDEAAACVWGGRADELLDFLQVSPARRITRESVLDAEQERPLEGLVLLDLPDHDSVATEHWEQVDRLLPLVDVLVWVVDPQKYADHALHGRYLRELRERQDAMLVLVNQSDTVPAGAVEDVCADVRRLLAEDGLTDVPVLPTSATERTGIRPVRDLLAHAVARPSTATRTAQAELTAVAARLRGAVGPAEPALDGALRQQAAAELCRACGTSAVAQSARAAVHAPRGGAVARPEPPGTAAVAALRARWAGQVTQGLPDRWRAVLADALPPVRTLGDAAVDALAEVPVPRARVPLASALVAAAGVLILTAVVLGTVVALQVAGWGAGLLAAAAGLLALGSAALAPTVRGRAAEERAGAYEASLRRRAEQVVDELLVTPTEQVLDAHRRLRRAIGQG